MTDADGWMPTKLRAFYTTSEKGARAGVYSPVIDRFLFVDHHDLWTTFHAAKLLSSKMPLVVFALSFDNSLTQESCSEWTIANSRSRLSASQAPVLKMLESAKDVVHRGLLENADSLETSEQKFALFVLRCTYALRWTDAQLNAIDHNFYLRFFGPEVAEVPIRGQADSTGWPKGFRTAIEEILYKSKDRDEIWSSINSIKLSLQRQARSNAKLYMDTFLAHLGPGTE